MKILTKLILGCFFLHTTALAATYNKQVELNFEHDNNIFQQPIDEISSFITKLKPKFEIQHQQRAHAYLLGLESEIGRYANSSSDDYQDGLLLGQGNWQLSRRASFLLKGHYQKDHDPRGSTDRTNIGKPLFWHASALSGQFTYGRRRARAQLETEAGHLVKRYEDFSLDDLNQTELSTRFFYRVLPKIRLFAEAKHVLTDYQLAASTQDNKMFNYTVGAKWEPTKKTTGSFKVGYLTKNFDADEREDFAGISWELALQWIPISHSKINVATRQMTSEATGVGDYVLSRDFYIGWTHQWKRHLASTISFYFAQTDFEGNTTRSDDSHHFNVAVNYDWRKWLSVSVGSQFMQRDSTLDGSDFERMIWFLTLKMVI